MVLIELNKTRLLQKLNDEQMFVQPIMVFPKIDEFPLNLRRVNLTKENSEAKEKRLQKRFCRTCKPFY